MRMVAGDAVGTSPGSHQGLAVAALQVVLFDAYVAFAAEFRHHFRFRRPHETAFRLHGPGGILRVAAVTVLAGHPIFIMPTLPPISRDAPIIFLHQVRIVAVDTDILFHPWSLLPGGFGKLLL